MRRRPGEIRQLLLEAGAHMFGTSGYAGATTDAIAEKAGVSMSVLFRHFPTKSDLYREAVIQPFVESMRSFAEQWENTLGQPADARVIMREVISDLYDHLRTHEDAISALAMDQGVSPETRREIQELFTRVFSQFQTMGEVEAERQGWFPANTMNLNSRLMVGMVSSMVAYREWFLPVGRSRISRERLVNHMADLMLYGLRLEPPGDRSSELPDRLGGSI